MRNRFIYSVKGYGRAVTEGEDPPRKKSFAEYFVNALFTIDEEERNKSNEEFPSATKGLEVNVPPCSETPAQNDDQMLKEVKQLPPERKISVLWSIVYGLIGVEDTATSEQPKTTDETETGGETTTCAQVTSGVENKGLDFDDAELKPCYPDQIRDRHTETNRKVVSKNLPQDSLNSNCGPPSSSEIDIKSKPSIGSGDPESGVSVPTEPKTARAWLKDPHLYKVMAFFLFKRLLLYTEAKLNIITVFEELHLENCDNVENAEVKLSSDLSLLFLRGFLKGLYGRRSFWRRRS